MFRDALGLKLLFILVRALQVANDQPRDMRKQIIKTILGTAFKIGPRLEKRPRRPDFA